MSTLTLTEIDNMPYEPNCVARVLAEPSRKINPVNPSDPSMLGYPPTFTLEIALRTNSTRATCEAYGITEEEWDLIRFDPTFLADLQRAVESLKDTGMSYKLKAKLHAEEFQKTTWRMVHDPLTPPAVKADLVKFTARVAGYDVPPSALVAGAGGTGFSININFNGDKPEPRVING